MQMHNEVEPNFHEHPITEKKKKQKQKTAVAIMRSDRYAPLGGSNLPAQQRQ